MVLPLFGHDVPRIIFGPVPPYFQIPNCGGKSASGPSNVRSGHCCWVIRVGARTLRSIYARAAFWLAGVLF